MKKILGIALTIGILSTSASAWNCKRYYHGEWQGNNQVSGSTRAEAERNCYDLYTKLRSQDSSMKWDTLVVVP
jgi:hypothetical protein